MRRQEYLSFNKKILNQRGQGVTEYILLLAIVAMMFQLLQLGLSKHLPSGVTVTQLFTEPFTRYFAPTYRWGDPRVKKEGESYVNHPRVTDSGNFKIFINPKL